MARVDRLPPPPEKPVRSPPVAVAGEEEVLVEGREGRRAGSAWRTGRIAARVHAPAGATRAVLICHPHPLYGGSMHSPVPLAIAKTLSDKALGRVAWARFDFRGVGESEGVFDDGRGEGDDALIMTGELRRRVPGVRLSICGHSFGSWVGLRTAARIEGVDPGLVDRVLLIAPSTRFFAFEGEAIDYHHGHETIFIGDKDEFCDVDEARALAQRLGADLRVFEGFDHHFMKSRRAMAEAALPVIAPEL
jgi:alpha/beta superfamily hydrolase